MKTKKKYLDENGLALISLTFILLSLVLVIFLTAYSLGNEARKDTRRYITDMRDKRFNRALLGQRTEQSIDRTPVVGMGGFMGDFGLHLQDVHGYQAGQLYDRRYARTSDDKGGHDPLLWVPDFFYNPSKGTWSGYRGKRYLYPLPAEEWPEAFLSRTPDDTNGIQAQGWKDGEGNRFWWFHSCGGDWSIGPGSFKNLLYRTFVTIKVKDYTCLARGALKLKVVLNKNGYPYEYTANGEDSLYGIGRYDPVTETFTGAGYNMHYFYFHWHRLNGKIATPMERCSRMIIYLQTENPAGSGNYITVRTYPLFVQVYLTRPGDFMERLFVKNITYRE